MGLRSCTLALAVALVWFGHARAGEGEEKAVRAVETLGGKVVRDEKQPGKPVVEVILWNRPVTDDDLKALAP